MIRFEVNQDRLKGAQRLPAEYVRRIARACSRFLNVSKQEIISIGFLSPREIRALNKHYRGKDAVTDVLSFRLDEKEEHILGEVLVCYEQAKRQAAEMKHSIRQEVGFLLVHGVLHLHGHDHEKDQEKKRMFALQEKILSSLGIDSRI